MFSNSGLLLILAGVGLAAFCGARLGHILDLSMGQSWVLPGFALGIALLGQAPAVFLARRVAKLERQSSNA